jgi:hypothetical protein
MTGSGVARFLAGWFLKRTFAFFAILLATLRHYLLADHLSPLHTTTARFRALKKHPMSSNLSQNLADLKRIF